MSRYPLATVKAETAARVAELGGRPLNLYRVLAHQPALLDAWVEFAYTLRHAAQTPRALRELMILRTAQMYPSPYEWHQHRIMAEEAGVPERQVAELAMWASSDAFSEQEKAALALTEAIVRGNVDDATHAAAAVCFTPAERIELVVTASFYCMVPRILDALQVPIEE